jgi:hypothetical protein
MYLMECIMNENYEQPKAAKAEASVTDFFRVVGPKDWQPSFSAGPFLPITSGGEGSLPYKMIDAHGSTIINYSQRLVLI